MKNFTRSTFFIFLLSGTFRLFAQTAGIPDFTFGQNGQVLLATPDSLHYIGSIALMPKGNILIAADRQSTRLNSRHDQISDAVY